MRVTPTDLQEGTKYYVGWYLVPFNNFEIITMVTETLTYYGLESEDVIPEDSKLLPYILFNRDGKRVLIPKKSKPIFFVIGEPYDFPKQIFLESYKYIGRASGMVGTFLNYTGMRSKPTKWHAVRVIHLKTSGYEANYVTADTDKFPDFKIWKRSMNKISKSVAENAASYKERNRENAALSLENDEFDRTHFNHEHELIPSFFSDLGRNRYRKVEGEFRDAHRRQLKVEEKAKAAAAAADATAAAADAGPPSKALLAKISTAVKTAQATGVVNDDEPNNEEFENAKSTYNNNNNNVSAIPVPTPKNATSGSARTRRVYRRSTRRNRSRKH